MNMDPAMMSQMLQNPMVQSMMQNLASNPQMLQAMMNPQMLQMVAQMRQSMPGLGAPGAMSQMPTATGAPAPGTTSEASPGGALPSPMFDPVMMQAMQTMMG